MYSTTYRIVRDERPDSEPMQEHQAAERSHETEVPCPQIPQQKQAATDTLYYRPLQQIQRSMRAEAEHQQSVTWATHPR